MCALLHDLQFHQEHETTIQSTCVWVDNTAAIAVAMGNDFTHETIKHRPVTTWTLQNFQAALNPSFAGSQVKKNSQVKALTHKQV